MHKHVSTLLFATTIGAIVFSPFHLQAQEAAASAEWLVDAAADVKIWTPSSQPEETVKWLGAEDTATGLGIAIWYVEGVESEQASGEWIEGKLNGYAVWQHHSGTRYEGLWQGGRRHGAGVYFWPDGTRFCGRYHEGHRQEGAFFNNDGTPVDALPPDAALRRIVLNAEAAALRARNTATKARRKPTR